MLPSIERCLGETSAHGIPHIVTGTNVRRRIFWALLFLGGTCVFLAHFLQLLGQYLTEPTSVTVRVNGAPFHSPDIHFCNAGVIFSNSYMLKMDAEREAAFAEILAISNSLRDYLEFVDLNNFPGVMWQTIPTHLLFRAFGHRIHQSLILVKGASNKEITADTIPHWRHLNCFRLRPNHEDFLTPDSTLYVYLFSDSSHEVKSSIHLKQTPIVDMKFLWAPSPDKSAGFDLYFTSQGEYPNSDTPKVTATPGYLTTIALSMVRQELLNKKTVPCAVHNTNVTYPDILHGPPATVTFERGGYAACLNAEFQRLVYAQCGCYMHYSPVDVHSEFSKRWEHRPQCFNITDLITEYFNATELRNKLTLRKACVISQWGHMSQSTVLCQKKWPCARDIYKPASSLSRYLLTDSVDLVFKRMLMDVYKRRQTMNLSVPGWEPYLEDVMSDVTRSQIHENFAKVAINAVEVNSTLIVENRTYLLRNLISDMGGILGFYMGISVLTVCELFSIVFDSLDAYFAMRKSARRPDVSAVDDRDNSCHNGINATTSVVI